ncbi:MAG: hypothetical protein R3F65_31985 [bacterium]
MTLLDALTDGDRAPWCLVSDLEPAGAVAARRPRRGGSFKSRLTHPDEADIPITSKNHDVKALRVASPAPEHWLFALVTWQTMVAIRGAATTASRA